MSRARVFIEEHADHDLSVARIAKAVNVEVIPLEKAPEAYQSFDSGVPKKFVIDPHHTVPAEAYAPSTHSDDRDVNGESLHGIASEEKHEINAALQSFFKAG